MPGRLRVYPPGAPVREVLLEDGRRYCLGRDTEQVDIGISAAQVSRRHLEIDTSRRPWRVADLGSKNGSLLDGRPLESAPLPGHAWLSLGGVPAEIRVLDAGEVARWQARDQQLRETTAHLRQRLDPRAPEPDLLESALESFLALADCPVGALLLITGDGRIETRLLHGEETFSGSRRVIRSVLESRRSHVSCDASGEASLAAHQSVQTGGIRALICLPLALADRPIGALYAHSLAPGKSFTELDFELLESIAGQAAFALAVARMREQLAELGRELPVTRTELEHDPELLRLLEARLPAYPPTDG